MAEEHLSVLSDVVSRERVGGPWKAGAAVKKQRVLEADVRPMKRAGHVVHETRQRHAPDAAVASTAGLLTPLLQLTIDSKEKKSQFSDETMEKILELAGKGSKSITVLTAPQEAHPTERAHFVVGLVDSSCAIDIGSESSYVVVEHLSTKDLDQGLVKVCPGGRPTASTLNADGGAWFGTSAAMCYEELHRTMKIESNFHNKQWKQNDPMASKGISIELGVSTYAGGSKVQMAARKAGKAFELKANALAKDTLEHYARQAAAIAWEALVRHYPISAQDMLHEVGIYSLYGTGFSKVTIAYDNPSNVHYDINYSVDVVLAFAVGTLMGGDHVMMSVDGDKVIVVETSQLGTLIMGCHKHLLHGNLGTQNGGRIVFAFYLSESLCKYAINRFKE